MKAKVLIVDHQDSFTFNLVELVRSVVGHRPVVFSSLDCEMEQINKYDKIILSPGPCLPTDFPNMFRILEHFGPIKSILGICLGHQSIAMHYGASLYRQELPKHGIQNTLNLTGTSTLYDKLNFPVYVGLYHSWAINPQTMPDSLDITAWSNQNVIMGVKHKQYDVEGMQFHPESIMTSQGACMMDNWLNS